MLAPLLVAYLAASSVPLATAKTFWWSYQGENSTESYDPVFEICADQNATSCAACNSSPDADNVGAKLCESSDKLSNICYEPKREETCCKDKYGKVQGEDVEDCGKTFNQTLSEELNDDQATATATSAFRPSMTATDQTRVARPDRTSPPNVVPGSTKTYNKDPEVEKQMSAAVKIGIAIGVFAAVGILVTLAVLALLHWRKKTKYNAIGHGQAIDTKHPEAYGGHAVPRPISGASGAFEPMRNEPHDHRSSWMASPPQHFGPTTPNPFSDGAAYSDHASHPQHPVELQHMPPPGHH
ncbi:uncharacterized protein N0V89_011574 [Didymosphaeria variabile]|uniref:Mid2 domain-containing protein n=1 Tax=Didymosphaeria variabile TaxID=1932322 RepID=A0A9W8XAG1_9PLEO|nr:uncharacterized protein N0V89_011574 [Didymosphaeria variabile]KAJ4345444.1 hypothetical protein N0V89_011574 [Didymosphaeria variabile]